MALHRLCGRTVVGLVLDAVEALEPRRIAVVVGPDDDEIAKELEAGSIEIARVPANVRHDPCAAVLAALHGWAADDLDDDLDPDDDEVLVVPASVPLLDGETLRAFHRAHRGGDASATVLGAAEGDSAIWFVRRSLLAPALRRTELPEIAALREVLEETGHGVATFEAERRLASFDAADRADLAAAEAHLRERINARWMRRGVTMRDPQRTYIDLDARLGTDVTLHPGVLLRGATVIGNGSEIGVGCHLVDSRIGDDCRLEQVTAELAVVGDHARVGPFAVLEPGAEVPAATVTGPFYTAGPDAHRPDPTD